MVDLYTETSFYIQRFSKRAACAFDTESGLGAWPQQAFCENGEAALRKICLGSTQTLLAKDFREKIGIGQFDFYEDILTPI